MNNNEYLENCLAESKGSNYLLRVYMTTQDKEYNQLVVNDLGFIYNNKEDLQLFKDELIKADIKEFILTESSSVLMNILHSLDSVNIKIKSVTKISYLEYSFKERKEVEKYVDGLLMEVKEV
jgi:hypothetical protein